LELPKKQLNIPSLFNGFLERAKEESMGGSKSRQQGKSLVTGQDGNRNKMQELESERESSESLDSVIVGAGFAGLYKLYRLRSNNANERTMTNKYSPTLTPHLTLLKFFSTFSLWLIPALLGASEPQIQVQPILPTTQSRDGVNPT
jgi:hypothetical protein